MSICQQRLCCYLCSRRGFGASTASYEENSVFGNGTKNYTKSGLEAAKDLKAAIDYMKNKACVDTTRIILLGQSTGGHSVTATGSPGIDGVIALINQHYGFIPRMTTILDQIWHKLCIKHILITGGLAKFVELPPYKDDGHRSFSGNRSVWAPM